MAGGPYPRARLQGAGQSVSKIGTWNEKRKTRNSKSVASVSKPQYKRRGLSREPPKPITPLPTPSTTRQGRSRPRSLTDTRIRVRHRPSPRYSRSGHGPPSNPRQKLGCLTIAEPVSIKYGFWRGKKVLPPVGHRSLYYRAWQWSSTLKF